MISARNLQLLSSGNKIILSLALMLFFFSGCDLLKPRQPNTPVDVTITEPSDSENPVTKTTAPPVKGAPNTSSPNPSRPSYPEVPDRIVIQPAPGTSTPIDPNSGSVEAPPVTQVDDYSGPRVVNTSGQYDIAVLLPFKANSYVNASSPDSIENKSLRAIEYFEGIIIALDQLGKIGANFNVYVYDTENSESVTQGLKGQMDSFGPDLIIGPIYNKPLRIIAEYAKDRGIPLINPLSPSKSITKDNRFFIYSNPPIESHVSAMYEYLNNTNPYTNVKVLCRATGREMDLANTFTTLASGSGMNASTISVSGEVDLESYMSAVSENVFVITSFNEVFVNESLRRLNILAQQYQITVYGMPNWLKFETLNLEYLENLNYHYTSDFYVDEFSDTHSGFLSFYKARFQTKPSEYAYKGFDMMLYFGKQLIYDGTEFRSNIQNSTQTGIYNNFEFKMGSAEQFSGSQDFYENNHVHVLRMMDYTLMKVN